MVAKIRLRGPFAFALQRFCTLPITHQLKIGPIYGVEKSTRKTPAFRAI